MHESESEVAQCCLTPNDPMDCSLPGFSIHGIFQARVLEWPLPSLSTASQGSHCSRSGQPVPQTSPGQASPGPGVSQPLVTPAPTPRGGLVQPVPTGRAPPSHSFHTYQPIPASPFHYPRCHLTSSPCHCARQNWGSRARGPKEGEGRRRVRQRGGGADSQGLTQGGPTEG